MNTAVKEMDILKEKEIAYLLKQVGIPQDIKGYNYLIYAIDMVMRDRRLLDYITKDLYPMVAKAFNTTSSRAERAMRHAVERAFDVIDYDIVTYIFGNSVHPDKGKPTTGHFIAAMAEAVRFLHVPSTHGDLKLEAVAMNNAFDNMPANRKSGGNNNG